MSTTTAPDKNEWALHAEEAVEAARNLPPGHVRSEALRKAGQLRNAAFMYALLCFAMTWNG